MGYNDVLLQQLLQQLKRPTTRKAGLPWPRLAKKPELRKRSPGTSSTPQTNLHHYTSLHFEFHAKVYNQAGEANWIHPSILIFIVEKPQYLCRVAHLWAKDPALVHERD
jgi:hypothetical protein